MKKIINKFINLPKDFLFFIFAISIFSFSQGIIDSTLNNFLYENFKISFFDRGMLEFPREMPGFLVIFMSAILFFLCNRRLASLANLIAGIGIFLIGFFSKNFNTMLIFLFVYSIGQHIFLPLNSGIGMELAQEGKTGRRLGQLNGAGNLFAILASLVIFIGFKFLKFNFKISFLLASIGFIIAAVFIFLMKPNKPQPAKTKFKLRKEYSLFYWLNILFGTRKQIFLTFAPWVLVSVFLQKTYVMGILLAIGGIIGLFIGGLILLVISLICGGDTNYETNVRATASLMVLFPVSALFSFLAGINTYLGLIVSIIIGLYGLWMFYQALVNALSAKENIAKIVCIILAVLLALLILGSIFTMFKVTA